MNLDKLKEAARKFEQREDWRRAIDVYLQAIREAEESGEDSSQDPGLYNRVGDLQLKAGDTMAALKAYEQAAERYADQGFFNNAIALCGKILRVNPSRTATYLRLAQLHARKNFVGEAKRNLLEYLERMNGVGQIEEAFGALKLFADQFHANPDIRLMLVELLRASSRNEEAREQLEKLANELEARGETTAARRTRERLHAIEQAPVRGGKGVISSDLVFLDTDRAPIEAPSDPAAGSLTETAEQLLADPSALGHAASPQGAESLTLDPVGGSVFDLDNALSEVEGLEGLVRSQAAEPDPGMDRELPLLELEEPGLDLVEEITVGGGPRGEQAPAPAEPIGALRERARRMLDAGDREGGLGGLEAALKQLEAAARWEEALGVASDLVRLEPAVIPRYQKQVELAYYAGRRPLLVTAYLELADALVRSGASEHAAQVYRRVLDHDAANQAALTALSLLELSAPSSRSEEEFVDLGAFILGEPHARDTRMKVGQKAQVEDEDLAFQEALADFKRGIEANIEAADFQSHYDLGIAFKEMGLVDEAIAQFQKALRSSEGRLKTSEQLGIAFFEQGHFGIAEAVLKRAVSGLPGGEDDKIGLLYWLGRSLEAQGRGREALPLYEQALAVDIRFLDAHERMKRLSAEARP